MRLWDVRPSQAGEQNGGFTAALTQNVCFLISDFFFFIPCIFISLFELWCSPKSAVQHWYQNNQIQAPSGFHLVWIVPYLYCTDGYYSADTFIFFFFVIFDSWGFSKIGLARARETHNPFILSRWLWTTFGNVNNSLFLFFFSFSFSSSTGIGTNTSLNQQCSAVVVIMKLSLMPTSFIKKTCSHLGAPSSLGTEIWR